MWKLLRLFVCFIMAIYLMQCFKWWAHVHGPLYDMELMSLDQHAHAVKEWMISLADISGIPQIFYFKIYALSFVVFYFVSVAINPDVFQRMITGSISVCIIGGMAYMLFPAYGPLIHATTLPAGDADLAYTQRVMVHVTDAFRHAGHFDAARFEAVLGAMPSLHVAHMAVIAMYMFLVSSMLGLLALCATIFIAIFAVATHFHYLADIPAGLLVAGAAIGLTERLYKGRPRFEYSCLIARKDVDG